MKHLFQKLLLLFLIFGSYVSAGIEVYSRQNLGDACWIKPCIRIVNNQQEDMDLSNYKLIYYFYEPNYSINNLYHQIWWFSGGSTLNLSYDNFEPPFTDNDLKADKMIIFNFPQNHVMSEGDYVEIEIGVRKANWDNFDETDDWSFIAGYDWKKSVNIVVIDKRDGKIVWGNKPGKINNKPISVQVSWMGEVDSATISTLMNDGLINEGDAYKSPEDGNSYVYRDGKWEVFSSSSGQATLDLVKKGKFSMDTLTWIDFKFSDILRAGTVQCIDVQSHGMVGGYMLYVQPIDGTWPMTMGDTSGYLMDMPEGSITWNYQPIDGKYYLYVKVVGNTSKQWRRVELHEW